MLLALDILYIPMMSHGVNEKAPPIVFHPSPLPGFHQVYIFVALQKILQKAKALIRLLQKIIHF